MGSTTDGGGGSKSGSELGQGIISQDGYIKGSALQVVGSAHNAFSTINGSPAGNQGGQGFGSGIVNQKVISEEVLLKLLLRLILVLIQSMVLHKVKRW